MKQMTEIAMEVAELRAENKVLKSVNDSLIQALHKPVVVRGGDSENQFVQHVGKYFDYKNVNATPNTPTEPLATEARDTGVSEGERCPRCKSTNLVDIDDHFTKCLSCDCEYSFVGG